MKTTFATRKFWMTSGLLVGMMGLFGCSSWQDDESAVPQTYSARERTSASGPVAFRQYNYQNDPTPPAQRSRYTPYGGSYSNPTADRYVAPEYNRSRYYAESEWDNRWSAPAQPEPAPVPQSRAGVVRDPLERQWNQLRQDSSQSRPRWQASTADSSSQLGNWREFDTPETGRSRVTSPQYSPTASTTRTRNEGFAVDYEALAPGSRLAEEQKRKQEEEQRLAEERRQQRLQAAREAREGVTATVDRPTQPDVGTDLPRKPEYNQSGRIESLREIARAEIKPNLSPSGSRVGTSPEQPDSVYSRTSRMNLAQLLGQKDPISLRSAYARTQVPVKISPRLKVDEWKLRLVYSHSTSIVPKQSQIVVSLDQVVVAQIEMVPDQPYNSVEIPLPKDLAKGRNHEFQIAVSQPLPADISTYGAPERFTQIDLEQSYLEVKGHMEPIPARLSEFQRLFDYNMVGQQYPIHFCIPGSTSMIKEYLIWGATVAQGVGLRVDNLPLRISHGERLRSNQDNILIGDIASIAPFLEGNLARSVGGPFIAIQPLYRDDRHFLIILSGRNDQEVRLAVEAFAISPETLPDTSYFEVTELQLNMTAGTIPVGRPAVKVPGEYTFADLGVYSRTMEEISGSEFQIELFLPGNYLPSRDRDAMLELHFTHSGQESDRSFLQVYVGNLFVGDISLAQSTEGSYRKRTLALPPQALRPGSNQIRLVNRTSGGNVVSQIGYRGNPLTILDSSRVVLPASTGLRELPDLSLMARSGYPLTDIEVPGDLTVYITDGDPRTVDSAWTLLAKIAQISGSYLLGVDMTFTPPEHPRNMLVMGLWQQLSDNWHEGAPLFSGRGSLEYRVSRRNSLYDETATKTSLFDSLQRTIERDAAPVQTQQGQHSLRIGIGSEVPENVILAQYENPLQKGYLVTMMAAASPEALYDGVLSLQEPVVWNSLHGEMMMLSSENRLAASYVPAQNRFAYRGEFEFRKAVIPLIWGDTWIQVLVILGALVLLALGTAFWIRRSVGGNEYPDAQAREEEI